MRLFSLSSYKQIIGVSRIKLDPSTYSQDAKKLIIDMNKYKITEDFNCNRFSSVEYLELIGETPDHNDWEILSRLHGIKQLKLTCGRSEEVNADIPAHWPIQKLVILGGCGDDVYTPKLLSIETFEMEYCCGLCFSLCTPDDTANLKRLGIYENDAIDLFLKLKNETCLIRSVEVVKIQSTNGCDFSHQYDKMDFKKGLVECSSIITLDLALNDASLPGETPWIDIPLYFPPNVQHLRFNGPISVSNGLGHWSTCILNPNWLPNLKTLSFSLSDRNDILISDSVRDACVELFSIIRKARPSLMVKEYSFVILDEL